MKLEPPDTKPKVENAVDDSNTSGSTQDDTKKQWQARMQMSAETFKRFLEKGGGVGQPEYYLQHRSMGLGKFIAEHPRPGAQKLRDILPAGTKVRKFNKSMVPR